MRPMPRSFELVVSSFARSFQVKSILDPSRQSRALAMQQFKLFDSMSQKKDMESSHRGWGKFGPTAADRVQLSGVGTTCFLQVMLCVSWKYTCVERDGEVRVWKRTSDGSGKFMLTKPLAVVRIQVACYPSLDGRVHTSLYYKQACVLAEDFEGSMTVADLCQMTSRMIRQGFMHGSWTDQDEWILEGMAGHKLNPLKKLRTMAKNTKEIDWEQPAMGKGKGAGARKKPAKKPKSGAGAQRRMGAGKGSVAKRPSKK